MSKQCTFVIESPMTENFIKYLVTLEKERDYYKNIAKAYRALKGKTLEDCPEACKAGFLRRVEIIKEWEG